MSDALPLPPRPNLEQYKKLAKDFQHACTSSDPGAIRGWAARWAEALARLQGRRSRPKFDERSTGKQNESNGWHKIRQAKEPVACCTVADAQFFVARGHGFASWPKFVRHLETLALANSPVSNFEAAVDAIVSGDTRRWRSCSTNIRSSCGRVRRGNIVRRCFTMCRRTASRTSARRRRRTSSRSRSCC